jgi:hypothetical protein
MMEDRFAISLVFGEPTTRDVNYVKSNPGHKGTRVMRNTSDSSIHNLFGSLSLLSSTADVCKSDARAFAHPAENSVLRIEILWDAKFHNFAVVQHTDPVIGDNCAQPV